MRRVPLYPLLFVCIAAVTNFHCGYMSMVIRRMHLSEMRKSAPSLSVDREIDSEKCYTVYGKIKSVGSISNDIAIAAVSYRYGKQEIVATAFACNVGFYSLLLPAGQYQLFAFADVNKDSVFTENECAGFYQKQQFVQIDSSLSGTIKRFDIFISDRHTFSIDQPVSIPLPKTYRCSPSHYYPPGAVRTLDDTLFSKKIAELGVYSPSEFLDNAGIYFYALNERDLRKKPILFVHGYGGSPREFRKIISELDSTRYDFWFFYYPAGQSINKTASIFYEIFFSNRIIKLKNRKLNIIAHSMGGLVTRQALNIYSREHERTSPVEFVSLCTPYGGIDNVRKAPVKLPSWNQLASGSGFLDSLHSVPLAPDIHFRLYFGFNNPAMVKFFESSDGTIELKSQLPHVMQKQAHEIHGFNETHESILSSDEVIQKIKNMVHQ